MRRSDLTGAEKATYQCWLDMKQRCYNERSQRFYTHGARGISVCDSWRESYEAFVMDMGLKPDGHSLDRVDNDGNYSKDNCRWATSSQQGNNRRTCTYYSYLNSQYTAAQLARMRGVSFQAMQKRLKSWGIELAMGTPRQEQYVRYKEQKNAH